MKLLVTGFEPFGGESRNPAGDVVRRLPGQLAGAEVHTLILPVVGERASEAIAAAVERIRPDAVLSVGQAGGRCAVTVERIAVNLDDFRQPDNAGRQATDEPIDPEGPDGIFSTLPVRKITEAIQRAGIPAQLSLSAGTYICNHLMDTTGRLLSEKYPGTKFGFIHIPFLPEQAAEKPNCPSMSLETAERAIRIALETITAEL